MPMRSSSKRPMIPRTKALCSRLLTLLRWGITFVAGAHFCGGYVHNPGTLLGAAGRSTRFERMAVRSRLLGVRHRGTFRVISSFALRVTEESETGRRGVNISTTTVDDYPTTNEALVASRQRVALGKKLTRRQYLELDRERNLRLKRLLHSGTVTPETDDSAFPIPQLYAVKVSVCPELRADLRMNGREKRGRVFIEVGSPGCTSISGLKQEMHSFFRCLKKSTYVMSASLPEISEDGSIVAPAVGENDGSSLVLDSSSAYWDVDSDEAVIETFQKALDYVSENPAMKRPSIVVHIKKDPNAPPPPPPPEYLRNMSNPDESLHITMLSFYSFPKDGIDDPEAFALSLKKLWKPFGALGRVYVAKEGVNAQMAVPTNVIDNFRECCHSVPELHNMENGINIDPVPLTTEEFKVAGDTDGGEPSPPFKNLHIRVRHQVVADGLDKPLDWQEAGYDMPPQEWHERIKELKAKSYRSDDRFKDSSLPLVFDCRNDYETVVGKFEGAEPLNTENFRDSWDVLKGRLADKPKDTPIMTYCTGGIRCVKVGAYLTQELGFTNVSRLAGGIIAYDRTVNSSNKTEHESLFKGTNYVFDGRVGRQITDDALGTCITCGEKATLLSNCKNDNCHKRMVQCEKCRSTFLGTCSDACKQRVLNSGMLRRRLSPDTIELAGSSLPPKGKEPAYHDIDDYSCGYSSPVPDLYSEIERNTEAYLASGSHMVSGAVQGRLLANLASATREGRVLEVGTFTGYATACFLEGSANAADAIKYEGVGGREAGPYVLSLERDSRALDLASSHLRVMSEFGIGADAALEARKLRDGENDAQRDSACFVYKEISGCELMKVSDALATLEEMASDRGPNTSISPFDIVFVDADKTRLLDYVETCLGNDRILKKGGLIVVDNVLWKGIVLEATGGGLPQATVDAEEEGMDSGELKRSRRARRLAGLMHSFNKAMVKDDRAEVLMLPLRDGLSLIRKR